MHQEKIFRFLLMVAATAVIFVVLRLASVIVAPMLMALFLTIVLVIPMRWLNSKGCPEIISMIVVLACTAAIFFGIGRIVVESLNDFVRQFPTYKEKIERKAEALDRQIQKLGYTFWQRQLQEADDPEAESASVESSPEVSPPETGGRSDPAEPKIELLPVETVSELLASNESENQTTLEEGDLDEKPFLEKDELKEDFLEALQDPFSTGPSLYAKQRVVRQPLTELNTETFLFWVGKAVVELQQLAKTGFLVMIITIFMLFEARRFPDKVDWALGKTGPINNVQLHHIAREIRRYLFIKSISCVFSAVAATLIYSWFGVPGAFFWGLVAFFLYYIPNLGGIIASIIPGLLIFMTYDLDMVLLYAIILASSESMLGYGLEPKMLGHGLGLSTVVIILSLLMWGWIFGPIGLFLAAPLTIMVKIILQAFKETEWIAILLGDKYQP